MSDLAERASLWATFYEFDNLALSGCEMAMTHILLPSNDSGREGVKEVRVWILVCKALFALELKIETAVTGWDRFLPLLHIFGLLRWDATHL